METYSITYKSQTEFAPDLWNQVKRTFKSGKKFWKEKDNLLFTGKLPLRFLTLEKKQVYAIEDDKVYVSEANIARYRVLTEFTS